MQVQTGIWYDRGKAQPALAGVTREAVAKWE